MKIILIYMALWIGLVVLAIVNGALRQKGYSQFMSELSAHQLSTLIFLSLSGFYIYFAIRIFPLDSSKQALLIGAVWLLMTICFEFIFGHYVMGHNWSKLFYDYNLIEGRVWIVVLLWTLLAPYIFYRIQS